MIDEISNDRIYASHEISYQEHLLAKHFSDVERRIRAANCREQALEISEQVIRAFENECLSEIIDEFCKRHMSNLVEKYWKA